jgi:hypothetical protein
VKHKPMSLHVELCEGLHTSATYTVSVFGTQVGTPLDAAHVRRRFKRICEEEPADRQ